MSFLIPKASTQDSVKSAGVVPSEITSQRTYLNRRDLVAAMAVGLGGVGLASWASREAWSQTPAGSGKLAALKGQSSKVPGAVVMEKTTPYADASSYNNFYEFGTDKADPAKNAHTLQTSPWSVAIEGAVKKPMRVGLEDLLKWSAMEERIYRMRCVEGWSMVIPWVGYSLAELIKRVEPNQSGAPVRLVVPWKYGFKNAKSIVKIVFSDKQPPTAWNKAAANEYGFYSNVNPNVDHPRWSQATERRLGEDGLFAKRRKTLMFNGYEEQVASLYAGMDLKKNF